MAKGIFLVILATAMWGISGVCGQFLFQRCGAEALWLITVRQISAGLVFMLLLLWRKEDIFAIWKNGKDRRELFLFSFLGLFGAQFGFYYTISLSNAPTATILQYQAPIYIMTWGLIRHRCLPSAREAAGLVLATVGVFLISTHGRTDQLVISPMALATGIWSAVALAFYTVFPARLLQRYSTLQVIGWGQVLSGLLLLCFVDPFRTGIVWNPSSAAAMIYLVIGGTVIPFTLFLLAIPVVGPTKATLTGCFEPFSSIVCAVWFLGTKLETADYIGMLCIIVTVLIIALPGRRH